MRERTACFTGHRSIPTGQSEVLHQRLENVIIRLVEKGYRFFGAGGALGFDTMAAQLVLTLKAQYPHIRLILVLPCLSPDKVLERPDQSSLHAHPGTGGQSCLYFSGIYRRMYAPAQSPLGGLQQRVHLLPDQSDRRHRLYSPLCPKTGAGSHQYRAPASERSAIKRRSVHFLAQTFKKNQVFAIDCKNF